VKDAGKEHDTKNERKRAEGSVRFLSFGDEFKEQNRLL
jgi:hypothetical protein